MIMMGKVHVSTSKRKRNALQRSAVLLNDSSCERDLNTDLNSPYRSFFKRVIKILKIIDREINKRVMNYSKYT